MEISDFKNKGSDLMFLESIQYLADAFIEAYKKEFLKPINLELTDTELSKIANDITTSITEGLRNGAAMNSWDNPIYKKKQGVK